VFKGLKGCLFLVIRRRDSFARWSSLWLITRTNHSSDICVFCRRRVTRAADK